AEFKAYVATLNGSWYQDLAFSEIHQIPKKGKLKIFKGTANLDVSKNNNYYETRNAEYGVYSDAGCTSLVATLVTGDDGNSQEIELDAGRYYIKEIKAPNGFLINIQVYDVDVEVNKSKNVDVYDEPIADPVGLLIRKVDSRTGNANPNLAGAEFTVKFYAGQYADGVDPATQGVQPTRTWILRTDTDGFIYLNDSYKVSGDSYYYNGTNNPTLPLGTVTMQETKAPDGYKINPQVFVNNIKPNGNAGLNVAFQTPTIQEDSLDFQIKKVQRYSDIPLPGTKFRHTKPDGSTEELVTGSDGYANIYGVTRGVHKIEEIEAPPGYILTSNEVIFEVTQDNRIEIKSGINADMIYSENNGNGHLTVSNMVRDYKFKVIKVDNETRANLAGAEFTLYLDRTLQNPVATKVTNDQGEAIFENLIPGTRYYLKETKTPDGYREILTEPREIYIDSTPIQDFFEYSVDGGKHTTSNGNILVEGDKHDRVVGLVVENDDVELRLKKDQLNTGIVLPGVKFRHTNPDGTEDEVVTDANGEIVLKALKRGTHKLVEIETISGYILNDSEFVFEVTNDNVVVSRTTVAKNMYYEDRNRDGYLAVGNLPNNYTFKITKINNHGALLEGAEFTLYSDVGCTNAIQTVTTDTQGSATFRDLVPGTKYYYKEIKAPEGYRIPLNQDGSEIITEIYATSTPIQDKFSLFVNGVEHIATSQDGSVIVEGDKDNRVAGMTVVNDVLTKLPETGSNLMIPIILMGSFLMLFSLYLSIKSNKKIKYNGGN
uniref:SpaA isopeptide-forming pilin-related protein n=1 Tax=uncultured Clostridium sp. TaxID=59620 RepID=UPI0025D88643